MSEAAAGKASADNPAEERGREEARRVAEEDQKRRKEEVAAYYDGRKHRTLKESEEAGNRIVRNVMLMGLIGLIARWNIEVAIHIDTAYFALKGIDTGDLKEGMWILFAYVGWKTFVEILNPESGRKWRGWIKEYTTGAAEETDKWMNEARSLGGDDAVLEQIHKRETWDPDPDELEEAMQKESRRWNWYIRAKLVAPVVAIVAITTWTIYEIISASI